MPILRRMNTRNKETGYHVHHKLTTKFSTKHSSLQLSLMAWGALGLALFLLVKHWLWDHAWNTSKLQSTYS